jgi:hypothetical protein
MARNKKNNVAIDNLSAVTGIDIDNESTESNDMFHSEKPMNYSAVRRLNDNTTVYAVATDPQTGEIWTMVRTAASAKPYYMIKDSVHGATINEGSDWKRFVGFAKKINSGALDPKTGKTMSNSSNARIGDLEFYLAPVEGRVKPRVNRTLHYMEPIERAEHLAARLAAKTLIATVDAPPAE